MKISVVITTFNRRSSLERCLTSLAAQTFPADEYEVVVIADGCSDDTIAFLRAFTCSCSLRWFDLPNEGQPSAQNRGVSLATGEYVLFMDDDCICTPGLLSAHYEAHARSEKLVVIGPVTVHPDSPFGTARDAVEELEDVELRRLSTEGARRSDLMLCANSSIARAAALECPFNASYKRMHDIEAGTRLWSKGFRPHFAPEAAVYELYMKTSREMMRDARNHGKYDVILSGKYPAFKPISGLVRINEGNPLKRALRKRMALWASATEFVLRPLNRIADALHGVALFSSLAKRVLKARVGTAHLDGAIREAGSWERLEEQFGVRLPVFLYHNVGSPRPGEYPGLTIPTAEFEAQIELMARLGYKGIGPAEWLRWRDEGRSLPKRPIMLVFDDAYSEACQNAFPILERHGFAAACMVVTECVGITNVWDEEAGRPSFQLMSGIEIVEWSKKNIEFGGHTRSHPELPLASEGRIEREIEGCKEDLILLLGKAPSSFAYPFGSFNSIAEASASRSFPIAFTANQGSLHLGTNTYLVPRVSFLLGESRFGMWCRLRLGKNPFEVCRNQWRKLMQSKNRRVLNEKSAY